MTNQTKHWPTWMKAACIAAGAFCLVVLPVLVAEMSTARSEPVEWVRLSKDSHGIGLGTRAVYRYSTREIYRVETLCTPTNETFTTTYIVPLDVFQNDAETAKAYATTVKADCQNDAAMDWLYDEWLSIRSPLGFGSSQHFGNMGAATMIKAPGVFTNVDDLKKHEFTLATSISHRLYGEELQAMQKEQSAMIQAALQKHLK